MSSVRSRLFLELSDAVLNPSTSHVFRHLFTPYQTFGNGFKHMSSGFGVLSGTLNENRGWVDGDPTLVVNLNSTALPFTSLPFRIVVYGRSLKKASSKDSDAAYRGTSATSFDVRVSPSQQLRPPACRHDSNKSIEFFPLVPNSDTISTRFG